MANCGEAGSVLDMVTGRSVSSSSSGHQGMMQALSSILGDSSKMAPQAMAMPLAPPSQIATQPQLRAAESTVASSLSLAQTTRLEKSVQAVASNASGQTIGQPLPQQPPPSSVLDGIAHQQEHYHAPVMQQTQPNLINPLLQQQQGMNYNVGVSQQQMHHHQQLVGNNSSQQQHMRLLQMQQQQQQHMQMQMWMQQNQHRQAIFHHHMRQREHEQQRMQQMEDQRNRNEEEVTSTEQQVEVTARLEEAWKETVQEEEGVIQDFGTGLEEKAWYDDIEKEFQTEMNRYREASQAQQQGNQNFNIEDLAEAWAQSDEWDDIYDDGVVTTAEDLAAQESVPYEFQTAAPEENASPPEDVDWFSRGMEHYEAGRVHDAIVAFESELRSCVSVEYQNADAWHMLGRCHAENDSDRLAISCLEQAVERDPYHLEALLALGVCRVNELRPREAAAALRRWVKHHPTYAAVAVAADDSDDAVALLSRATALDRSDARAWEALGVCRHAVDDHDGAVEAFRTALSLDDQGKRVGEIGERSSADDAVLWSRLGAALANGRHSEEALPAYSEALRLRPGFARAWLNLAISHGNLQNHVEAARCYLQALSLMNSSTHRSGEGETASNVWSYLRISLACLERWDLYPAVAEQDLNAFRDHFDFE